MENHYESSNSNLKKEQISKPGIEQSVFSSGKSFCFTFKNMILNQIPTQMTRIYIKTKVGKSKSLTNSVPIMNNTAKWDDKINIDWKNNLSKKSSKKAFKIRFSFRFENLSGKGFTRYGNVEIDLNQIQSLKNWEFSKKLCDCNYDSIFSCLLSIEPINISSSRSIKKNNNSSLIRQIESNSFSIQNNGNQNLDDLFLLNCLNEKEKNSKTKSFYIPTIFDLNDSSEFEEEEKLPFRVNQEKMNLLKYQVDGIILAVMQPK